MSELEQKPPRWYPDMPVRLSEWISRIIAEKCIVLAADFAMSGLWTRKGDDFPAQYLPVTKDIVERLYGWIRMFEDMASDDYDEDNPPDVKLLADTGYAIGMAIKTELPDWQVSYCDALYYYLTPTGGICPELLADGSLGECVVPAFMGSRPDFRDNGHILFRYRRDIAE